jgi:hypothetical protein
MIMRIATGSMRGIASLAGGLALFAVMMTPAGAEVVTRPAAGATRVLFRLPGTLTVRHGQKEQVTVDAEAAVLPKLEIAVRGDTLVLASRGSFKTSKPLNITVTLQALRQLRSEGSGDVVVENFTAGELAVEADGSGHLALTNIAAERLTLALNSSGDIEAAGSGKALVARIAGAGTIDASRYRARTADAEISGSGNIKVHADESLTAAIRGAGNIEYLGKAKVTQSVSGAGSIDKL